MKTYGIIVAMEKEIVHFKEVFKCTKEHNICNITFYEGIYLDNRIVFTKAGIGKVNAAVATTLLIEHFSPSLVINTGIAGGYNQELKPLDIVVADKVFYSDVDMTSPIAGSYKYGQIEGLPDGFETSYRLLNNVDDCKIGSILTGDQFVDNYEKCNFLVKQYFNDQNVLAFDMESGSIAQICTLNKVDYIIMRAISDIIGSTNEFDYLSFSTKAVEKVSRKILEIIK